MLAFIECLGAFSLQAVLIGTGWGDLAGVQRGCEQPGKLWAGECAAGSSSIFPFACACTAPGGSFGGADPAWHHAAVNADCAVRATMRKRASFEVALMKISLRCAAFSGRRT